LNENFPAYHLFTAFLASNLSFKFSRQTKKILWESRTTATLAVLGLLM
jgi:hypothetical protein